MGLKSTNTAHNIRVKEQLRMAQGDNECAPD